MEERCGCGVNGIFWGNGEMVEGRIFEYGRVGGKHSVSGEGEIKEVRERLNDGEKSKGDLGDRFNMTGGEVSH